MNDPELREILKRLLECLSDDGMTPKIRRLNRRKAIDYLVGKKTQFDKLQKGSKDYEKELAKIKAGFLSVEYYEFFLNDFKEGAILPYLDSSGGLTRGYKILEDDIRKLKRDEEWSQTPDPEKLDYYALVIGFLGAREAVNCHFDLKRSKDKITSKLNLNESSLPNNKSVVDDFQEIRKAAVRLGASLGDDHLDELIEFHKSKNIFEAINEPDEFLDNLFDEIINSEELSDRLKIKIELLFNPIKSSIEYSWPHRVILASSLSLSILTNWDEGKILLLKRLMTLRSEPLVFERSMIGLGCALLKSSSEPEKFSRTLKLFEDYSGDSRFHRNLAIMLEVFSKHPEKNLFFDNQSDLKWDLDLTKNYQYFEPLYQNNSFFKIDKSAFDNHEQMGHFFTLFNKINMNHYDSSVGFLTSLMKSKEDLSHIYKTFIDRVELDQKANKECNKLYQCVDNYGHFPEFKYVVKGFFEIIFSNKELIAYQRELKSLFSKMDGFSYESLFVAFPSITYLKILPFDKFIELQDINNPEDWYQVGLFQVSLVDTRYLEVKRISESNFIKPHQEEVEKYKSAIKCFQKCIEQDKEHFRALAEMGGCMLKLGLIIDAEEKYRAALHAGISRKYLCDSLNVHFEIARFFGVTSMTVDEVMSRVFG